MPEPWLPEPPRRRISPRAEKALLWLVGVNLLMLLIAPIGGASLIEALICLLAKAG